MENPESGQQEVFAFLARPETYGFSGSIHRFDTHGAAVFLAGPDVYKVKRAVCFPFMDFSTLEKRKTACEAEITVNRRLAPDLYLGVVPISRDAGGVLHLGGEGEVIEWVVHLRRFDEAATFDHLAAGGEFSDQIIGQLAEAIETAHRQAPAVCGTAAIASFRQMLFETTAELRASPDVLPAEISVPLCLHIQEQYQQLEPLLLRRASAGQVRRCHADLHLRNIVLHDGRPVLFDALEFDETLATIDVLYDLAFLLMDLCDRGLVSTANRLLNRYLWIAEDQRLQLQGLAPLAMFLALRAAIRAKVITAEARQQPNDQAEATQKLVAQARHYLGTGRNFFSVTPPRLLAIGGLSGSGKSTFATALAPGIGAQPGAVHLRSDIERKRLFGVGQTTRLAPHAYSAEISATIYRNLRELAKIALQAGRPVILDATYHQPEERKLVATLAAEIGVPFTGIWLDAPADILRDRIRHRHDDASDATESVVLDQLDRDPGVINWKQLDARQPPEQLTAGILSDLRSA